MPEYNIGRNITPHLPVWVQNGNKVLRKREEEFEDRAGNKATLTVVTFLDKKGKEHEAIALVKWHASCCCVNHERTRQIFTQNQD